MANYKAASIEQDFMFVDEDGNPIESNGENLIYVDDAGREIQTEKAVRMLESGDFIDTRVLYEDKNKKKALSHMAGEARVRDQIRDEIVAKAYQMALIKDPNALARNRAEEQAFLKINKPKNDDFHNAPPVHHYQQQQQQQQQPQHQQPQHQQQTSHHRNSQSHQTPVQQRLSSQQRQRAADEQARHRADDQARLKAQAQARSRAEAVEKARAEQANAFARNRSHSTERSLHQQQQQHQQQLNQQQAQMRSRNATPITPMRLERSASRGSNHRGKENLLQQQQLHQQQQNRLNKPVEQSKTKEDQMLSLLKNQLLKKQQELMPAASSDKLNQQHASTKHQPLRRDASKILVNKNTSYY